MVPIDLQRVLAFWITACGHEHVFAVSTQQNA